MWNIFIQIDCKRTHAIQFPTDSTDFIHCSTASIPAISIHLDPAESTRFLTGVHSLWIRTILRPRPGHRRRSSGKQMEQPFQTSLTVCRYTEPVHKPSPQMHRRVTRFSEAHPLAVCNKSKHRKHRNENSRHVPHLACSRSITATPLFRARTLDLKVVPPRLPQPPPEQNKRARECAEDTATCTDAVPRGALRPHRVFKPRLQHIVVLVRRRFGGNYARECSRSHWREELEYVWDLGLFREDDGCVASGRVRT